MIRASPTTANTKCQALQSFPKENSHELVVFKGIFGVVHAHISRCIDNSFVNIFILVAMTVPVHKRMFVCRISFQYYRVIAAGILILKICLFVGLQYIYTGQKYTERVYICCFSINFIVAAIDAFYSQAFMV